MTKTLISGWLLCVVTVACALLAYHRSFSQPPMVVGIVDVAEIMRAKEKEYTVLITKAGSSEAERQAASTMAAQFAMAFPTALQEMSGECQCVVLLKSAVVSAPATAVDLTPRVREKLGMS